MTREETIERCAKALTSLIAEHGANNNFLASEVAAHAGVMAMRVGQYGAAIAGRVGRESGRLIVYAPRVKNTRDPLLTHSYFCVDD